ncbi:helicase HelZ [Rhodococcoides trifolii]|uniref:Helicase HelZ n=1 Tax=Rhodococcoides trifolii TaxID=908250 RepID=A0A917CX19_9NOCA|nr:DEAD/DEAH box helicase [Rhodococcus trifolii]GGG00907.1 helicase HelZ [Rhodococcus trifolii]
MLHGLWTPGAGLMLWDDETVGPEDAGDELPPVLAKVMTRKFRHRPRVTLPSPPGTMSVAMPAIGLAPPEAVEVLLKVPRRHSEISGDLRFLGVVVAGLQRWVRAGRVVPQQHRAENQWWTRWELVGGEAQRAWLAELIAVMPPVQTFESGGAKAVLDDLVGELTDPLVRRIVGRPDVTHPLLESLLDGEPYQDGTARSEALLTKWRDSLQGDEPDLVLRLLEPEDLPESADTNTGSDTETGSDTLWRLEVLLRPDGEAPQPVPVRGSLDPTFLRIGVRKLGEAINVYPRLRDVPSDPDTLDLLLPTEVVIDLVQHGATPLREKGITVLLPRAWSKLDPSLRLKVESPPTPATEDRAVGMNEIVSYDWQLALGDMVLTEVEMSRMIDAKSGLVRMRGQWVQADAATLAKAIKFITDQGQSDAASLKSLLDQLASDKPPPVPIDRIAATGWAAALLDPDRKPEPIPVPDSLKATLRPYQQRGLDWLVFMSSLGLGAVLADDMGLGKTIQVLALLAHEHSVLPTLLVSPMSVVGNWQREAAKFVPDLKVHVHHGADRLRDEELTRAVVSSDLVVTTYALLARDVEQLQKQSWRRIVLDEAQHIKNHTTRQSKAASAIPADHRLALTGTPVENRLDELRSILNFTNKDLLGSPSGFRARFAVPIEREKDETAVARLRSLTSPFVLRRVKTDKNVIADLPDKFEMTVRSNLTAEQASLYQAVVDDMMRQIAESEGMARKGAVLATLTRLKQICNHPAHFLGDGSGVLKRGQHRSGKLALVEDILESVLGDGEKALLFTQFREFGDIVAPHLSDRFGRDVPFLHGGVSKKKRDEMVESFQSDDGPPIMALSLKAGGTGLNLTAANHVVHLDRWWNPAVENQATDRAFRIGQRKNVQVRKLLCVGTVEERIDSMLTTKKDLADLAVGTGESWVTEMSTAELRDLMSLSRDAVGD